MSLGVVPRDVDAEVRSVRCNVGSTEPFRDGVCIPDGVDCPLNDFLQICWTNSSWDSKMLACGKIGLVPLVGAGLAAPDLDLDPGVTPFEDFVVDVTPSLVGLMGVEAVTRRVGMRDELPSSVLSSDKFEP